MKRRSRPLPPGLGSQFSVSAALAAGVTEGRLRGSDLESPFWGVRSERFAASEADGITDEAAAELRHRIDAYAQRMAPTRFFVELSALVIWLGILISSIRIDADDVEPDRLRRATTAQPLDVGVFAPERTPRAKGVRGHQLKPHLAHAVVRDGLRVTSAASTWASLARVLEWRDLIAVGSLLVTRPRGDGGGYSGPAATTLAALAAAVDAGPRTGVENLRAALPWIREGARSRPEVHLFLALTQAGVPEPRYDVPVFDDGALVGIFDLAFEREKVLVEYQGDYHRTAADAWAADIRKRERAREAGWIVVEISRRDLYPDASIAVARVARALAGRER